VPYGWEDSFSWGIGPLISLLREMGKRVWKQWKEKESALMKLQLVRSWGCIGKNKIKKKKKGGGWQYRQRGAELYQGLKNRGLTRRQEIKKTRAGSSLLTRGREGSSHRTEIEAFSKGGRI